MLHCLLWLLNTHTVKKVNYKILQLYKSHFEFVILYTGSKILIPTLHAVEIHIVIVIFMIEQMAAKYVFTPHEIILSSIYVRCNSYLL